MSHMASSSVPQMVLIGVLLVCGYFCLLPAVMKRTANKNAVPVVALVLLAVYAVVAVVLLLVLSSLGGGEMMLFSALLLLGCGVLAGLVFSMVRHWHEISKWALGFFLVYVLLIGYVTIFSRGDGSRNDKSILMVPFASVTQAIRRGNTEALEHMLLNVAMFVPLGIIFPMIDPPRLGRVLRVLPVGLMCTVAIESTQLFFLLGQCDIDDIIANTLGAVIGTLGYRLFYRITHKDEENEEAEGA